MPRRPDIDGPRLLADLETLARIGGDPSTGGVTRLAFSAEDRAGRDFVADLLAELSLETRYDAIGNAFAVRPGARKGIVFAGSHTDTVGSGGRFDGALGVLAAVAALRAVHEAGITTRRGLGVVSFVNEEGVRFMPDMMGSLYVRGSLDTASVRSTVGTDGMTIGEALDRSGMAGTDDLSSLPVRAYLELHIEQGPVLAGEGIDVGIVTGVQGLRWMRCRLEGAANHAGTTPMTGRRDAVVAAARIAVEARALTREIPGLRATVGHVRCHPGLVNVVAGSAECTVDLRHPDAAELDRARHAAIRRFRGVCESEGVALDVEELAHAAPVTFDPGLVSALDTAAAARGLTRRRLLSGAGHDAQILQGFWPAAMLFVPSRDGISHSPLEYSSPEACLAGARVLLDAMLALSAD